MGKNVVILIWILLFVFNAQLQNAIAEIPHLEKQGTATRLIVNDKPFLILGGELGNSSASSLEYMQPIWQKLVQMNLNTVLIPAYWELIEPEEGQFNFTITDSLILSARENNLKIVFLWFGSWKNSMSCYAPYWVKDNYKRFPRAYSKEGKPQEIMTPFSDENRQADVKVFSEFMRHIKAIDEKENTVIMVQVENEIGMIPDARDYCTLAAKAFKETVPSELISFLKKNKDNMMPELKEVWQNNGFKQNGTWEEIFGTGLQTDEIFMAWHFASYTNYVAEAGKKEYPLPMYANAALIRPGAKPGQYPSAGPLPHIADIWKAAAPSIDFLAPDIYFRNFAEWCEKYRLTGTPLFIPEAGNNQGAANAYYAFGKYDAIGYSPFSIESLANPENNQVHQAYDVLKQLAPLILDNAGKATMAGVLLDSASQKEQIRLGNYIFNIKHEYSWPYATRKEGETPRYGGLIIMLSEDEYLIAGTGIVVTFESPKGENDVTGIGSMAEGKLVNGKWVSGVIMNGDQSHQGRHMDLDGNKFSIQKVKLYKYK